METAAKPEKARSNKGAVVTIIVLIVVIGALIGGYFVLKDMNTLTTDNVKVTADLNTIVATGSGKLRRLMVAKGDFVTKDQIVAEADNTGYLKSPVSGEIVECDVTQGQMVSPSTAIAVVADTSDIYVQANIEETSIRRVRAGQIVRVSLDAYPGQTFIGIVREIDRITQNAISGNSMSYSTSGTYTKVTQTIPVKIDLRDRINLGSLIGTNATVTIQLD
jgi:multidrug resistance efflux pump